MKISDLKIGMRLFLGFGIGLAVFGPAEPLTSISVGKREHASRQLALNAASEAARTGEHGREFAVVAAEELAAQAEQLKATVAFFKVAESGAEPALNRPAGNLLPRATHGT